MKTMNQSTRQELLNVIIDKLKDLQGSDIYACDLHHEIFNTDYFIIGRYEAEQWLINNGGIFNAIETIKEFEQSNFGQVSTDLSEPEKVCNMYVYILGEEILGESELLREYWDDRLTDEMYTLLIEDFESM